MKKASDPSRPIELVHQIVSLTGINFATKSIIGFVELHLIPLKDSLRHIRLNAKQCRIYKVSLNGNVEASFQYFDPTLEVCQGVSHQNDLETYSGAHLVGCDLVDPDMNGGEVNIKIPSEAFQQGYVAEGKLLKVGVEFSLEDPQGGIHFVVPPAAASWSKDASSKDAAMPLSSNVQSQSLAERAAHLFTCGYEKSSRLWFPCIDTTSELCTWKLEFTVDESMTAISCGDLVDTVYTPDLKRKTFHYVLNVPTAAPNIGLAVGPFEIYVDPNINEITHFCLPHLLPVLKSTARWVHEAFDFFEMTLATRYPYSSYKQVFVDEAFDEMTSYSTLSVLSTTMLATSAVIDQTYETRKVLAHAVASQFYGCFIVVERWSDRWLRVGLASYLAGLYLKKTFGNNEYRMMVHKSMEDVVKYEEENGGIILDSSQAPAPPPVRGEVHHRESQKEPNAFPFPPSNLNTCSPEYLDVMTKKAHLSVRMLEDRIGADQLLQVLNKQLALATTGSQQKHNRQGWTNMIISTTSFTRSIFLVTGKDMGVFMDQWVRTGGHARFHMEFVFNRKRNTVEMVLSQDAAAQNMNSGSVVNQPYKGVRKYVGPVVVALQELDGWFKYTLAVEQVKSRHDITCHSKSRRNKKKKIPLVNNEEVDMDLSAMEDSPVLWIRIDPDMQLIRSIEIAQPDFQWQYQLKHERDVTAQAEAVLSLEKFPSPATKKALNDIIENEQCFYMVRCLATHQLTKVDNAMAASWNGPPANLVTFKKMFGSFTAAHIIKQNDFSNLQSYFLQKEIPLAMAKLRNSHGICPPEVSKFLLDLFKYNDNSKNTFSDNYYRAALVDALGETVTAVVSVLQAATGGSSNLITAESLSSDTKLILEEISRYLNLEKLLPSYRYTVTKSCLKAIRMLQKTGHLPSNPEIFKDYAAYEGQFVDVRLTALECLVDFVNVEGSWSDLTHLMDMVETDPVPYIRHRLIRLLVKNPPFERGRHHPNNKLELVDRLWTMMNSTFWYDSRLRCGVVDLYHRLYGRKRPGCLPLQEIAMMRQPSEKRAEKPNSKSERFTIPRSEKRKPALIDSLAGGSASGSSLGFATSSSSTGDQNVPFRIPAELSNTVEARDVLGGRKAPVQEDRDAPVGEVPDFFAFDSPAPGVEGLAEPSLSSSSIRPSPTREPKPGSKEHFRREPPDGASSSSHHKKKKKKDKKKHRHKEKKKSKKHGKNKDSSTKKRDEMIASSVTKQAYSSSMPEDFGISETSAQGLSSGSSSPNSVGNSPKRIKLDM